MRLVSFRCVWWYRHTRTGVSIVSVCWYFRVKDQEEQRSRASQVARIVTQQLIVNSVRLEIFLLLRSKQRPLTFASRYPELCFLSFPYQYVANISYFRSNTDGIFLFFNSGHRYRLTLEIEIQYFIDIEIEGWSEMKNLFESLLSIMILRSGLTRVIPSLSTLTIPTVLLFARVRRYLWEMYTRAIERGQVGDKWNTEQADG